MLKIGGLKIGGNAWIDINYEMPRPEMTVQLKIKDRKTGKMRTTYGNIEWDHNREKKWRMATACNSTEFIVKWRYL